ncbi:hypothetical protein F5X68DRAFT_278330 [Plectosphaerella plurivora]|uniref:Uncharacterized protein n=1 Tax=Plectosphaerella plurivora TaxID=936078 RepID=A0A9P8V5M5_9PEZI|nr:hypothetical protein F5X68DRAFT_278330 [Plectosphaerella plurivora]
MAPATSSYRFPIILFAFVVGVGLWICNPFNTSLNYPSAAMSDGQKHQNALAQVAISLKQTATSPPAISVTVTNNYDTVMTLLNWNSPLDPAAVALGVFSFTPEGASAPLDIPTIAFRRVMPPPPETLITLQPGESTTKEFTFEDPAVPVSELGKKAKLQCSGDWASAWPGYTAAELTPETLDKLQYGDQAKSGPFSSEAIELVIG